jgi:hypothetical protein
MRLYRAVAAVLGVSFAAVGLLFLALPAGVLGFFNSLSAPLGFREAPAAGFQFYLILASGYMYVVTLLAWLMFRRPENDIYSRLLVHAKLASAGLSLGFFIFHQPYLVYLVNFLVDGFIGLGVLGLHRRQRRFVR